MAKLAADGTVQWTTTFGSPGGESVQDITVDDSGHIYASFYSAWGTTTFADTTYIGTNLYQVVQLDPTGGFKRAISTNGIARLAGIRNELYMGVAGTIVRLDTALAVIWTRGLSHPGTFGGSTTNNAGIAVRGERLVAYGNEATASPLTIAGLTLPNNGVAYDQRIVVCLDTAGAGLWGYMTDGTNGAGEVVHGIALDGAGRTYLGIYSYADPFTFAGGLVANSNANPNVCALARLDAAGNEEWVTTFEPIGSATVDAVTVTANGESYITGSHTLGGSMPGTVLSQGGAYLGKVASDGSTLWLSGAAGSAGNNGGYDLDMGVNGAPLWFLSNHGALNMHCVPIQAGGANRNLIITEVTDLPPITPVADFSFMATGLDVQFTNGSMNATGWIWDLGDGSPLTTVQDPLHTYASPGIYNVTLTADLNGVCTSVISQEVDLLSAGAGNVADGDPAVQVMPNPTTGLLVIKGHPSAGSVDVVDATGRSVLSAKLERGSGVLDLSSFKAGWYLLQVLSPDRRTLHPVLLHP